MVTQVVLQNIALGSQRGRADLFLDEWALFSITDGQLHILPGPDKLKFHHITANSKQIIAKTKSAKQTTLL